jgi:sigma-B regulation protein RsbU (phosphoserine phosphatase)
MFEAHTDPTATHDHTALRDGLMQRRQRLVEVASRSDERQITDLLAAVDDALRRFDDGSYGICRTCHVAIDRELLADDPLVRVCLECFSDDARRALERDLEHAAAIQTRLLPPRDFAGGGWEGHYVYQPHGAVSGDFCDVIPDGESTLVLVGDVSGKGVAAALLMSHLSAVFRGLVGSGSDLAGVMSHANRMFGSAIPPGSFATLAAARLGPAGAVEISNAGHVPPLYHNGRVHRLPPDGVPLGLFCESVYTTQCLQLKPGERLVLATDGLIESTDPESSEYGLDALAAAIAEHPDAEPRQLASLLVENVRRFRQGRPASDDTAVMVVRRTA